MAQQRALLLSEPRGEWHVGSRSIPKPGPGEVVVKILATGLNPVDWKVRTYAWPYVKEYPAVLGSDAAGTIEEVGEGVTSFQKGDRVLYQGFFTNDQAAFQQYSLVPAEITAKIPENISFEQAASIPLGLATAAEGLFGNGTGGRDPKARLVAPWQAGGLGAHSGKPLVLLGGSSSVGQYVIQLAKLSGFSPIITTASLHNTDLLKELGATHVVDRHANVVAEVSKILNGTPADIVYDAISLQDTQDQAWEILAPGGELVLVGPPLVDKDKYKDKHTVNMIANVHISNVRALGVELYSVITEWLENGTIKPNRVEILPNGLAGIPGGLALMEKDAVSGKKLIARPFETA